MNKDYLELKSYHLCIIVTNLRYDTFFFYKQTTPYGPYFNPHKLILLNGHAPQAKEDTPTANKQETRKNIPLKCKC